MKNFITYCILNYLCLIFLCGCTPKETIKANLDMPAEDIHASIDVEPSALKKK